MAQHRNFRLGGVRLTIHSWTGRLLVSLFVLFCVSIIVVPHLMDVHPPILARVLMWPMDLLGPVIGKILPRGNIGTAEHPIYEGTPLDVVAVFALAIFSILLYPVFTLVLLTVISRVQSRRQRVEKG